MQVYVLILDSSGNTDRESVKHLADVCKVVSFKDVLWASFIFYLLDSCHGVYLYMHGLAY